MNNKKVVVTGVLGQDGANMVEYLLKNTSYLVYGIIRRSANPNFENLQNVIGNERFKIVYGDLTDEISVTKLVRDILPDYFINFAAMSFVGVSWDMPLQVMDVNALGVMRCLEAIRRFKPDCRFYSAGSSEEMGDVVYSPQDLDHPIRPRSPYGASKAAARHIVKVYRESYNLFAIHSILFNHEGTKRGEEFVTRKITKGVARILTSAKPSPIELGNLDAKRDWSDSEDFVEGIWMMLNQNSPKEYILASGETHTIREFAEIAFGVAGMPIKWVKDGAPENEHAVTLTTNIKVIQVVPKFFRPAEVNLLLGDPTLAKKELGWNPKTSFKQLVTKMVKHDYKCALRT